MKKLLFCLTIVLYVVNINAQKSNFLDSVKIELNNADSDTAKATIYLTLTKYYQSRDIDSSIFFANQANTLSRKNKSFKALATGLNYLGNSLNSKGEYHQAVEYFIEALEYAKSDPDLLLQAKIYNNIGISYYYLKQNDKALSNFKKSGKMLYSAGDTISSIVAYNNIGGIYMREQQFVEANAYFNKGYLLAKQIENEQYQAILLSGLGASLENESNLDDAIAKLKEALEIKIRLGMTSSAMYTYSSLGSLYLRDGQNIKAIENIQKGYDIASQVGNVPEELMLAELLHTAYDSIGNSKKALEYLRISNSISDSINVAESNEKIAEIQSKYDKVEDSKRINELEKNQVISEAKSERQSFYSILLVGGGMSALVIAALIYYRLRNSRKQNQIIQIQKEIVDEKNREIIDSINYAQRIQQAMLNSEKQQVAGYFEHFILFKPKDIVSGDFYWFEETHDAILVGAVDCTGHGVPGAFLTLLGTAFLNDVLANNVNLSPAELLDELRSRIIKELGQSEEGASKDGMDMSLIKIYKTKNVIEWAGANNPLWIAKKNANQIREIKADKEHIGYSYKMSAFTNHEIELDKGDQLYIFSDGFSDQFGGLNKGLSKEKKFKSANLKKLIMTNFELGLDEQKNELELSFEDWKGNLEQLDDVCLIGIRL